MTTIFKNTRIIDLTDSFSGSRATSYLADYGADVIKVENPKGGDYSRNLDAVRERVKRTLPDCSRNYYFEYINRNKKSLAVDLEKQKGREVLYRLVKGADVFVTTYEVDVLNKLGISYETMCKMNPNIVYARCSGFGRYGPAKDLPLIDYLAQSRAGLMSMLGEPGQPPVYTGTGEVVAATALAYGITVALFHRLRTGEGQEVDVSLFSANILMANERTNTYLATGVDWIAKQAGRMGTGNPLFNTYPTKTNWIFMCMMETDRFWPNLCKVLDREDLINDPRFDTHAKRCGESKTELIKLLDEILPTRTAHEWFIERSKGMYLNVTAIHTYRELCEDAQALDSEAIVEYIHPSHGQIKTLGFPLVFTRTAGRIKAPAPHLGQHTNEILRELGYASGEILDLAKNDVIVCTNVNSLLKE